MDSSSRTSASLRPMKRLMEKMVFSGLVTAWRLATVPTRRSPPSVKATTDGVVRPPSALSITVGSPPSSTAMQLFVVPRSIPMVLPMLVRLLVRDGLARLYALRVAGGINLSLSMADLCRVPKVGSAHERLPVPVREPVRRQPAPRGHERGPDPAAAQE